MKRKRTLIHILKVLNHSSVVMALLAKLVRWTACGILGTLALMLLLAFLILPVMSWILSPPRGELYLWRIEGSPPSYLYGTIHIPFDLIWPAAPTNTKEAFEVIFSFYHM